MFVTTPCVQRSAEAFKLRVLAFTINAKERNAIVTKTNQRRVLFAFVVCVIVYTENALALVAVGVAVWPAAALANVTSVSRKFGIGL